MNEKIEELLNRVGIPATIRGPSVSFTSTEPFHHLVELVVRECAEQVDWILAEGGKTQGDLIKQHFGIK